jgi:prepilin-type N-terminal cleavage/methylation domain-containing protein
MRLPYHATRSRRESAGFTLVELMTVVAITGILATLAVVMVRDRVNVAKSSRALVGVQAIRVAEEQYKAQGGQYLDCSQDTELWYPDEPTKLTRDWRKTGHTHWPCWQKLGIPRTSGTQYAYLVTAGLPGGTYPPLRTDTDPALQTPPTDLWYVIQVKGDVDGDGVFMRGVAASLNSATYVENEEE